MMLNCAMGMQGGAGDANPEIVDDEPYTRLHLLQIGIAQVINVLLGDAWMELNW